jgi:hypothetical protein
MAGRVAIVASVLTALGLGLLAFHDPGVAERLTAEDGAIEWIQVLLCAAALLISVPSARSCYSAGRPIMFDVLILTGLAAIVIGEVDLDKRIFGVKIIATRFFVDQHIFLPYRMLAVAVVVGTPLAIGLCALRNWRQLWFTGLDALRQVWGRVLLAAVLIFAVAQIFERPLGRVPGLPRYFLEESLELIAGIWFLVAATARLRAEARVPRKTHTP